MLKIYGGETNKPMKNKENRLGILKALKKILIEADTSTEIPGLSEITPESPEEAKIIEELKQSQETIKKRVNFVNEIKVSNKELQKSKRNREKNEPNNKDNIINNEKTIE